MFSNDKDTPAKLPSSNLRHEPKEAARGASDVGRKMSRCGLGRVQRERHSFPGCHSTPAAPADLRHDSIREFFSAQRSFVFVIPRIIASYLVIEMCMGLKKGETSSIQCDMWKKV
jgi:hypothetical protein